MATDSVTGLLVAAETNEVTRSGTLGVCDGPEITRDPQLRARVPGLVIFVGLEQPAAGTASTQVRPTAMLI